MFVEEVRSTECARCFSINGWPRSDVDTSFLMGPFGLRRDRKSPTSGEDDVNEIRVRTTSSLPTGLSAGGSQAGEQP